MATEVAATVRVCLQVTRRGVTPVICSRGDDGQFSPGNFLPHGNFATLDDAVRFFDGDDYRHTHTVVVWDCLFPNGGMYRVQHGASMHGYAGWYLHEVVGAQEQSERHAVAVAAAGKRMYDKHAHRAAIVVAFERVEKHERKMTFGEWPRKAGARCPLP